jgi:putative copper export protein
LILHAWSTHAAAATGMDRLVLLTTESLHLAAAGAWLGSLAPLLIVIGKLPADQGAIAARRFSPLGMLCAAALAATALIQGEFLIGGLARLVGSDYGLVALVKLAMLAALLGLAATNRFRYLPALTGSTGADARRRLRRNIGLETTVGLAAVLAAAFLSSLPPARHAQAAWRMNLPMPGEMGQSSPSEYGASASAPS